MAEPNALSTSLEPLYTIAKCIGVFPFSKDLLFSKKLWIYSLYQLTIVDLLSTGVKLHWWVQSLDLSQPSSFITYLPLISIFFGYGLTFSHSISMYFNKKKMISLGRTLVETSKGYTYSLSIPRIHAIVSFSFSAIKSINLGSIEYGWIYKFAFGYSHLQLHAITMTFCACLEAYQSHFKDLIDDIDCKNLELLTKKATKLMSACEEINDIYGLQMLVLCGKILTNLVCYGFSLVVNLSVPTVTDLFTYLHVLGFWCAALLYEIYVILIVAGSCRSINVLVERFNVLVFRKVRQHEELKNNDKLNLYIAMNPTIEFTACGYFSLGHPLVTSIFATATTYIVIFVQFNSPK